MSRELFDAIGKRRSYYAIGNEKIIPDDELIGLIRHAVKYAPSAFNSQSSRLLVLLNKQHERLWEITWEVLKPLLPEKAFSATQEKLGSFKKGYGTILYFEDQATIRSFQERFPLYKDNFPAWSLQSSGMLQYAIWTMLESKGYGANLQHYNPLIDSEVGPAWDIPEDWKLIAQMPFGKPLAGPDGKSFLPPEDRIKVVR